jgi:hypothetical protein
MTTKTNVKHAKEMIKYFNKILKTGMHPTANGLVPLEQMEGEKEYIEKEIVRYTKIINGEVN